MARRRYQRGCLFKRGMNWILRYREDVLDADGNPLRVHRSAMLGQFSGKKKAWQEAERRLQSLNHGAHQPQSTITLHDFWTCYFEPEIVPTVKFSTRRLYRSLAGKHLLPAFGRERLNEIARVQVQQFIGQKQRQGYSTQTLRHLRNLLSKLFGTAISWGWLDHNAAKDLKLPPMERKRQARVLTLDEINRLVQALTEPARTIFVLGLLTGLRVGELLALRTEDIDFQVATVYVRRAVYCGQVGTTKTSEGTRTIPLAAGLVCLLRNYLVNTGITSAWLFPSRAGTPCHDRNLLLRNIWPVCDRLSIPRFGWHSLRHTFTTYGGNSGVPMPVMQSLLGHTSAEMTMLYTHPLRDAQRKAVERLAEILFPNVPTFAVAGKNVASLVQ